MNDVTDYGLLYSRDPDSTNFPLTELERACRCFRRRPELRGFEPAVLHLHPAHLPLATEAPLGLTVKANARLGQGYLWLQGRAKANCLEDEAQDGLPD